MTYPRKSNIKDLSIYKKALDVFTLSRQIAAYVTYDKDIIAMHRSKSAIDNYADKLVIDSLELVPKIVETENETNQILKLRYAKSIRFFIDRIYQNSRHIEANNTEGTDFIKLLRIELKKLRILHNQYVRSLIQLN